jgi:hypothetical protein
LNSLSRWYRHCDAEQSQEAGVGIKPQTRIPKFRHKEPK